MQKSFVICDETLFVTEFASQSQSKDSRLDGKRSLTQKLWIEAPIDGEKDANYR